MQVSTFAQRADYGHKITTAFEEGYLVDSQGYERLQAIPIHAAGNPAVEDAEECVIRDVLFGFHISEGATYQLEDEMAFVGLGMQSFWVVPIEPLGSGGMVLAPRAAQALRPDAQIHGPTEARQMAQEARLIHAMGFANRATTAPTRRADQRALDSNDELALLGQLSLEHTDIGDVERDRDKWVLGHRASFLPIIGKPWRNAAPS